MENAPLSSTRSIAKIAGVSHMTVSLALRNHPSIPLKTALRIQKLAQEVGYRPNPMVHALMSHLRKRSPALPTTTLAYITAFPTRHGWRKFSEIYSDYFYGAAEHAQQLGYHLEEFWAKEPKMTSQRLTQILMARGIRGVLVGPLPSSHGHLSLNWSKFAAVALGKSMRYPNLHRVTTDHYGNALMALRRLTRMGYKRIGLWMPSEVESRTDRAALAALLTYQYTIPVCRRVNPLLAKEPFEENFLKWFCQTKPDAVMSLGSQDVQQWIKKNGSKVPEEVAFISLQRSRHDLSSGINTCAREIGAAAVDLLHAQLLQNEFGVPHHSKTLIIKGKWQEGFTTMRKT